MCGFLIVCCTFVLYKLLVALWRVLFHPLSKFPGPYLAAATSLYRVYYEVIQGGEFLKVIERLHKIYGEVVRIGPNELHFSNPSAYNDIYSFKHHYPKDSTFYKCFGVDHSTFGTTDPGKAKERRRILAPLFSRRSARDFENIIQEHVDSLIYKLAFNDKPSDLFLAFRCATLDIITSYCFGRNLGALESKDFAYPLLLHIQGAVPFFWLVKSFPRNFRVLLQCPTLIISRTHQLFRSHLAIRQQVNDLITLTLENPRTVDERPTFPVYRHLLSERHSPVTSVTKQSLFEEALSLLQAGSDTVGNTCTVGMFHVLNNPAIYQKLVQELAAVSSGSVRISLLVLQRLPYLTAVIKESLRISHGFVSPLPRVVKGSDQRIAGLLIPHGTVVGMSVTALHNNNTIFPNPENFNPDRWLVPDNKNLDRLLVPFSRGPRMCLGINLAWVELYIVFGNVFSRLNLRLDHTSLEDFTEFKDYFVPLHQGRHLHVTATQYGQVKRDFAHTACS
ncbi:cytochrome P450 [Macrolepiota fuliginosa MF-IS2]|uniref:Cytochrome P450 n=1 Tax=Macrolepiota fuliginosa MF-IS2 TaxID=1400762 RepID=A0A9P6C8A5_9AGAR|nr:cytochrome P450 [Macrolepiota fuliginosa MF-IS2]